MAYLKNYPLEKKVNKVAFLVLLIVSFVAFCTAVNPLKWLALFLTIFSWSNLYKEIANGKRNRPIEYFFSFSSLILLLFVLYVSRQNAVLAEIFVGDIFGSVSFCALLVFFLSIVKTIWFPYAMPKQRLQKKELPHAILSNALIAVNEELWFRGAILFFLLPSQGAFFSIFSCAFLFSLMHLRNQKIFIWSFCNGLILSIAMVLFRNIFGPILGHFLLNMLNRYHFSLR